MSSNLVEQHAVLESELAGLEKLLALDLNWRKLSLLERVGDADLDASVGDGIRAERDRLRKALAANRIYCARERILEAIKLIQDETRQSRDFDAYANRPVAKPPIEPPITASLSSTRARAEAMEPASTTLPPQHRDDRAAESASRSTASHANDVTEPPVEPADPLHKIRGIDEGLARSLGDLGIRQFSQIALWTHTDVAHVSRALHLGRRVSRENWIEQAALLSGQTCHESIPRCGTEAKYSSPAGSRNTSLDRLITEAATAIASRFVSCGLCDDQDQEKHQTEANNLVGLATRSVLDSIHIEPIDCLQDIRAIDDDLASRLATLGVGRFEQIANWTAADVARIGNRLNLDRRIQQEGWIEQAALLFHADGAKADSGLADATERVDARG